MNTSTPPDENTLAYTGVSLLGNRAQGEPPEWHELHAWRSGNVSTERSAQILSYVANDPDVFQQWLDLVEAEQWVSEEITTSQTSNQALQQHTSQPDTTKASNRPTDKRTTLSDTIGSIGQWLRSLLQQPVYGGALAAVLLAVLIVPLMRQTEQASLQKQMDRSTDMYIESVSSLPANVPPVRNTRNLGGLFDQLSITDVERQAFQFGLSTTARAFTEPTDSAWQSWLDDLPVDRPNCSSAIDQQHCEAATDDISILGNWALLTYAACQRIDSDTPSSIDADIWQQQADVYDQLRQTTAVQNSPLFGDVTTPLAEASPELLCNAATQLLSKGQ